MRVDSRWSWYATLACVGLVPLAATTTSLTLGSLPATYDAFVVPKLAALGVLAATALALWAASAEATVRWHRAAWALAALLGLASASTAFGLDPAVALFGRDAANGLVAYLSYGALFFLVLQHATGVGRLRTLAGVVVASGTVVALGSLYQAIAMTAERVDALGLGAVGFLYGRGGGVLGNPDYVGAFLVVPFVLAVGTIVSGRDTWQRIAGGVGAATMASALVVTQVRAGWLGAMAGLIVLTVTVVRRVGPDGRRRLGIVAAAVVAALALSIAFIGPAAMLERVTLGVDQGLDAMSSGRLSGWRDSLAVIGSRPLLGTGPDSFTLGWYPHATALADASTGAQSYFEDPHNVYLAVAATLGVPALLAFLALVVLALRAGLHNLHRADAHLEGRALLASWLAALAGVLITAIFTVTVIPTCLMLFVALAAVLSPAARPTELPTGGAAAGRLAAVVLAVALVVGALVPLVADYHLGQHMRTGSAESLERARSIAPFEKRIQLRYLDVLRAALDPLLPTASTDAVTALDVYDREAFALAQTHPHELLYTIKRLSTLGYASGYLGADVGEKTLSVVNLALIEYPQLQDLRVAKARTLGLLDRSTEAIALLEPMEPSVSRDTALVEAYLNDDRSADARSLALAIRERYAASPMAEAFLGQATIRALLDE